MSGCVPLLDSANAGACVNGTRLEITLDELSGIQREAVEWTGGPLLVLAGPGSGKTRVLTCRIARLLDQARDQRFRILALTFTNKAAHEMSGRVTTLAPGLEERAYVHTFHGFCAQVLRQHGVHLGIKPDFAIYSRASDRQGVLEDALSRAGEPVGPEDRRLLPMIDDLKTRLVGPAQAESWTAKSASLSPDKSARLVRAYRLYEAEMRRTNALDFNSLILEAYALFAYPAMARHYQTVYRYWLIDEFQDTNDAQYRLIRRMAGERFRQIFAVADDDQTIYEWNGANVRRIGDLVKDFSCNVIQLPTNYRCPPSIVEAANRLVVYNARRVGSKLLTRPAKLGPIAGTESIQCRVFATDAEEVAGIADEIADLDLTERGETAVLARNRRMLDSMLGALSERGIPAEMLMRRDDFVTPELRWVVACLKQLNRPLDKRNMATLIETFGSYVSVDLDFDELVARSSAEGFTYLSVWTDAVRQAALPKQAAAVVDVISKLAMGAIGFRSAIDQILTSLETVDANDDLQDDLSAWRRVDREIRRTSGSESLDGFLQELEMRSKEPSRSPGTVSLATIHGAKGLEFEVVFVVGLAEEILPSWHSVKEGVANAALEEERRGCFVAITRTKRRLILSRANRYSGWPKRPSRFLVEMGLLGGAPHEGAI